MRRGDVWLAEAGGKRRPVLVLTRGAVLDVRALVTVAEITASPRGLAVEVELDHHAVGLERPSVVNADGLHTVAQTTLSTHVGALDGPTLSRVCAAIAYALGC
ncbi:MAG: type II toxin-antitoxin system PemK/MazF family toxin [Solirubrobacterales bacterium]